MNNIVRNDLGTKLPGYEMTGNEVCGGEHVCHFFQEALYAHPWTTRKISHVPCLRILLPGLWKLYAKAGNAYRAPVAMVAICEGNSMRLHTAASWYLFLPRKQKRL